MHELVLANIAFVRQMRSLDFPSAIIGKITVKRRLQTLVIVTSRLTCSPSFMFRASPFFSCLATLAAFAMLSVHADGQHYALGEPEDIVVTVNPTSQVAWDATGDGNEELMAFDLQSGRLVALETKDHDASDLGIEIGMTRDFSPVIGGSGTVFSADTDGDGENDLLLLSDDHVRIWNGGVSRAEGVEQAPDAEFQLPNNNDNAREWLGWTDLNGDGSPDFVYHNLRDSKTGVLTGFDAVAPRMVVVTDSGNQTLWSPQIVENWDGAGQNVLAFETPESGPSDDGSTLVYAFDANLTPTQIDEIPALGLFAPLLGAAPPELVEIGNLPDPDDPIATVYQKVGEEWVPETLEDPADPIEFEFQLGFATSRIIAQAVVATGIAGKDAVYFTQPRGPAAYYRLDPSFGGEALRLRIETADEAFSPEDFSTLRLPNSDDEVLAIRSVRKSGTDFYGTPLGNNQISLRRKSSQGILKDIYSLVGSVGNSIFAEVDAAGTPDLVSVRSGDGGVTVYYQAGSPILSETATYPADSPVFSERVFEGDFSGNGVLEVAISAGRSLGSGSPPNVVPVFKLTPEAFQKTGSTAESIDGDLPDLALGSGDFTGDGSDELLFIDSSDGNLRYASFDGAGVRGGGDIIAAAGRNTERSPGFGAPPMEGELVQPKQVIVTDADGDGDTDILAFPSALGQRIALHRNDGDGNFALEPLSGELEDSFFGPAPMEDGVSLAIPTQLFAGNFLQGGEKSLLTCGFGGSFDGKPSFKLTTWSGSLADPTALASSVAPILGAIAVADVDGDGLDDLIAAGVRIYDEFGDFETTAPIVYLRSNGDGTFSEPMTLAEPLSEVSQLVVEDVDLDGVPDVVAILQDVNSIILYRGQQQVTAYPTFAQWAAEHSPDMPGLLDRPDGGEQNLVLYARGEVPSPSMGMRPPAPPVAPSITLDGETLSATHPVPIVASPDSIKIALQYSFDLAVWIDVEEISATVSSDAEAPVWRIKEWQQVLPEGSDSGEIFHRFRVEYVSP